MIKSIIFDLDGMVHRVNELFSVSMAEKHGINVLDFFNNEYIECRIGKLDTKEVLTKYVEKWNMSVDDFIKLWNDFGYFDKEVIKLIFKFKEKNIKCILATNNVKTRIESYDELKIFDNVIASYDYGVLKDELFQVLLDISNCNKEEILYCDDKTVDKANDFGFKTFWYKDFDEFREFLDKERIL